MTDEEQQQPQEDDWKSISMMPSIAANPAPGAPQPSSGVNSLQVLRTILGGMANQMPSLPSLPQGAKDVAQEGGNIIDRFANPVGKGSPGFVRKIANEGNLGYGAGALASLFTANPLPIALASAGGASLGSLLPGSQNPATDIGASAANIGLDAMIPGAAGGSVLTRLLRSGVIGAGTGAAAYTGSKIDQAVGNTSETPWGTIGIYTGAGAVAGALKAATASSFNENLLGKTAGAVEDATGVKIPLTLPQRTGFMEGLASKVIPGTAQGKELGYAQSQSAIDAAKQIFNHALDNNATTSAVEAGEQTKFAANKSIRDWVAQWKDLNKVTTATDVDTGILDASGNPIERTKIDSALPSNVAWTDFEKTFGISPLERDALFNAIHTGAGNFVEQLTSDRGLGALKGSLMLRSLMRVLPAQDSGTLGTAVVLRALGKSGAIDQTIDGPLLNGLRFAKTISDKANVLKLSLGPDRYQALQALGTVMKETQPSNLANPKVISQQSRIVSYLANKAAFTIAGIGAGATMGYEQGHNVRNAVVGAAVGGTAVLSFATAVSMILAHPQTADVLMKAARGDTSAANSFIRTMYSTTGTDPQSSAQPKSSLDGLFQKK